MEIAGHFWQLLTQTKTFRLRNHFMATCPHSGLDLLSAIISNVQQFISNISFLKL